MPGIPDLELRRVDTNRDAAHSGIQVITQDRPLTNAIPCTRGIQGQGQGRDGQARKQQSAKFRSFHHVFQIQWVY